MKDLYARLWRWHFFAALIVIPFVLWQSITGTLYLWSEWWMDEAHPQLRFVKPQGPVVPVSEQIQAALRAVDAAATVSAAGAPDGAATGLAAVHEAGGPSAAAAAGLPVAAVATVPSPTAGHHHGMAAPAAAGLAVQRILIPDTPTRSTTVLLQHSGSGLPFPVFVDPYTGQVLGQLSGTAWLPGITRALHGGWPLGDAGSWLLELGDCWAILMLATGLYLWWPRGRGVAALWPRSNLGKRVLLRDLHSCVAVWFSIVFLFFLISALPWTAFWGGQVLRAIETNTGQSSPAGFSPGGASAAQFSSAALPIEQAIAAARRTGARGTLDIRLAPWEGAPLFITNSGVLPAQDRTLLADPRGGAIRGAYTNGDLPVIPRLVALGIHVHQADFGPVNVWLNTAFAFSLLWLVVTGVLSWWNRRPAGKIGAPPRVKGELPVTIRNIVIAACIVLPLFGISVLLILLGDSCRALITATRS